MSCANMINTSFQHDYDGMLPASQDEVTVHSGTRTSLQVISCRDLVVAKRYWLFAAHEE